MKSLSSRAMTTLWGGALCVATAMGGCSAKTSPSRPWVEAQLGDLEGRVQRGRSAGEALVGASERFAEALVAVEEGPIDGRWPRLAWEATGVSTPQRRELLGAVGPFLREVRAIRLSEAFLPINYRSGWSIHSPWCRRIYDMALSFLVDGQDARLRGDLPNARTSLATALELSRLLSFLPTATELELPSAIWKTSMGLVSSCVSDAKDSGEYLETLRQNILESCSGHASAAEREKIRHLCCMILLEEGLRGQIGEKSWVRKYADPPVVTEEDIPKARRYHEEVMKVISMTHRDFAQAEGVLWKRTGALRGLGAPASVLDVALNGGAKVPKTDSDSVIACRNVLVSVIAVRRFLGEYGRLPTRVEQFAKSEGDKAFALDPFVGGPLRLEVRGPSTIALWSVGPDLIDNGGKDLASGPGRDTRDLGIECCFPGHLFRQKHDSRS